MTIIIIITPSSSSSTTASSSLLLNVDVAIGPQCLLEMFSGVKRIVELVVEEEYSREGVSTRRVREGQRDVTGKTVTV